MKQVKEEGQHTNLSKIISSKLDELNLNLQIEDDDKWVTGDERFAHHMNTITNPMKVALKNVLSNTPILSMGEDISKDIVALTNSLVGLRF